MMLLDEYCTSSTNEELHDMLSQINEKPRWELTAASYKIIHVVIKELKKRKLLVQPG
jgi:hypothetical protein